MRTAIPSIYFGTSDLQMTPFVTAGRFRMAVVEGLLFHGDLIIPDAFWFMSKHLADDIRSGEDSVVLPALQQGWIRPHFREKVGGLFGKGLAEIRSQGIIGLLPDAEDLANQLDRYAQQGVRYRFAHWPSRLVGRSFLTEIQRTLVSDDPPTRGALVERIWHRTREMRNDCVSEALDRSRDSTLRRGELLDVVGRRHAGWKRTPKVPNADALLQVCPRWKRPFVRPYIHWVNQCYQRNQARLFRKQWICTIGKGAQQVGAFATTRDKEATGLVDVIERDFALPPLYRMASVAPAATLALRASPEAKAYFRAFAEWRKSPESNPDRMELLSTLDEYCGRIHSEYTQIIKAKALQTMRMVLPTRAQEEKELALQVAWNGIGQIPLLGLSIYAVQSAWSLLAFYQPDKAEAVRRRLNSTPRRRSIRLECIRPREEEVGIQGDTQTI